MALCYKLLQIIRCSKMFIDLVKVLLPVAMVTFVSLCRNWRYPNRVCSHTLNVVQFLDYTAKVTPTVIRQIVAWGAVISAAYRKAVCKDLHMGAVAHEVIETKI